jgi:Tol biopolymer transport system component
MNNTSQLFALIVTILICCLGESNSLGCAQSPQPTTHEPKQEEAEKSESGFPESDIFLFDLDLTADSKKEIIANGKNVTAKPGYENQPFFVPDGKSFLFVQSAGEQTDIFEYFLESGETKQVTDSKNMEFSPQSSPDNQTISFVTDGEGANQSVWKIQRSDPVKASWLLESQPEREPVGYYSWNHETGYIVYWSRYGFSIRLVHESKEIFKYVSGDAVPSSPQIIPGTNKFSFLHRQGDETVYIKELDPETLAIRPLVTTVGSNSHYGWTPNGTILMIEGSVLHLWSGKRDEGWKELVDLSSHGVASATRLMVSPDGTKLAVVGQPTKPE